ncbi:MAG: hypothetical protein ACLRSL_07370 [Streptococcus sp.]
MFIIKMATDQLVNLTNSGVEIHGFDSSKLGEQHLEVSYLVRN